MYRHVYEMITTSLYANSLNLSFQNILRVEVDDWLQSIFSIGKKYIFSDVEFVCIQSEYTFDIEKFKRGIYVC